MVRSVTWQKVCGFIHILFRIWSLYVVKHSRVLFVMPGQVFQRIQGNDELYFFSYLFLLFSSQKYFSKNCGTSGYFNHARLKYSSAITPFVVYVQCWIISTSWTWTEGPPVNFLNPVNPIEKLEGATKHKRELKYYNSEVIAPF